MWVEKRRGWEGKGHGEEGLSLTNEWGECGWEERVSGTSGGRVWVGRGGHKQREREKEREIRSVSGALSVWTEPYIRLCLCTLCSDVRPRTLC